MKRIAESPVLSDRSKDARTDAQTDSPTMSYIGALRSRRPPPPLPGVAVPDEGHTAVTDGAVRNNFVVDILQLNGEKFHGTIKHLDAIKLIFVAALGFKPQEFAGAVPGYRGNPTVLFKTKEAFDIDVRFADLVNFSYVKRIPTEEGFETHTYDCSIRGVRGNEVSRSSTPYTWVKIEGADYQVDAPTIKKWLMLHGTLMTDLTEDKLDLELDSGEEEFYQGVDLTTGTYSVKMSINKPIAQFLPMAGKKIRIYHKGIAKLCSKCYGGGHLRQDCQNEQDNWLSYVDNHMIRWDLDESYYGRWCSRIADWRLANEVAHGRNRQRAEEEWNIEKERRKRHGEQIVDIVDNLRAQSALQQQVAPRDLSGDNPDVEVGATAIDKDQPEELLVMETDMDVETEDDEEDVRGSSTGAIPKRSGKQIIPQGATANVRNGPKRPVAATGEINEELGRSLSNLSFGKNRPLDDKRGRGTKKIQGVETTTKGEEKTGKPKTRSLSLTGK